MGNIAYTIINTGTENVLIVGVVGKSNIDAVSQQFKRMCLVNGPAGLSGPAGLLLRENCAPDDPLRADLTAVDAATSAVAAIQNAIAGGLVNQQTKVVLMAQMPRDEASVVATRIERRIGQLNLNAGTAPLPSLSLVLTEASLEDQSADLHYQEVRPTMDGVLALPRLLTPGPAYQKHKLEIPIQHAIVEQNATSYSVQNTAVRTPAFPAGTTYKNTGDLFWSALQTYSGGLPGGNVDLKRLLLDELGRGRPQRTDVVLAQRRDFFLDALPEGYDAVTVCPQDPTGRPDPACALRVAIDRILWRGDHEVRVMLSGASLKKVLTAAQTAGSAAITGESPSRIQTWLVTYGIVSPSAPAPDNPFSVPQDLRCRSTTTTPGTKYCVNGTEIVDDQSYWISTSESLAYNTADYSDLGGAPGFAHRDSNEFLSEIFTDHLGTATVPPVPSEARQQREPHWTVDFAKLLFSDTYIVPFGGNGQVNGDNNAALFQGATNNKAYAPSVRDIDAEVELRSFLVKPQRRAIPWTGFRALAEYERSATGVSATPSNPKNQTIASYPKDTMSFGPLLQFNILPFPTGDGKKWSPLHVGTRSFTASAYWERPIKNVPFYLQDSTGTYQRIPFETYTNYKFRGGFRVEALDGKQWYQLGLGSHIEVGYQQTLSRNVLTSATLAGPFGTGSDPNVCSATQAASLSSCLNSAAGKLTGTIVTHFDYDNTRLPGMYWDIHLLRPVARKADSTATISLLADSAGEFNAPRAAGNAYSTQDVFAIPLSSGFSIAAYGNLSISPTINFFYYRSQVTQQDIMYRGFTISLRYYTGRENRVPFWRQATASGPSAQSTLPPPK